MGEEKERVDIVILNWNGLKYLKDCIKSIKTYTSYPYRIIIVDNASTDGSVSYLRKLEKKDNSVIVHYNSKQDSGFAEGVNTGLKYCTSKYVLLMNNDIIVSHNGWLKALVDCIERDSLRVIVGCKLLYPNDSIQHAGVYFDNNFNPWHIGRFKDKRFYNEERECASVTFACVLIRREILERYNGLDESYILGMYEDTDFCMKVRKDGYKVVYCPNAVLYHYESPTWRSRPPGIQQKYLRANWNKFIAKWRQWMEEDRRNNPHVYNQ